MNREEYEISWLIDRGTSGKFALCRFGAESPWKSHTGRDWYEGTAGGALAMLTKAFYRYGAGEDSIFNYRLVIYTGVDVGHGVAATFEEPCEVAIPQKTPRAELTRYSHAWEHKTTGKRWTSPSGQCWFRQRANIVRAFKAVMDNLPEREKGQLFSSLDDFVEVKLDHKTKAIVTLGRVLGGEDSRQELSGITLSTKLTTKVIKCLRQSISEDKIMQALDLLLQSENA